MRDLTYDWNGNTDIPMDRPDLTDFDVAVQVRMLTRDQLNHEMVCTLARDRIMALSKEVHRLRACLESTRDEICEGPVDDVLWHTAVPACTTVDNITMALRDDWTYDGWLDAKSTQS